MISSNAVGIVPLLSPQYDGAIGAGLCGRRDSAGDVGLSRSCYDAQGKQLLPFAGSLIRKTSHFVASLQQSSLLRRDRKAMVLGSESEI
jgi:hypothetical protein